MFRTEISLAPATGQLPRTARVLTVGSCFADSIGARLAAHKVDALVNPFGTVFQPLALGRLLRAAAGEEVDWQQHLVEARGRWQSYDLHGSIGADSPVELLQIIQELVRRTGDFLRQADLVLLTLGTAWAYRLRETGELVSNCHKQLPDLFVRELLTPDEIINSLAETHAYLKRINPELRFVLTVSPVRHLKDTLPLNAVSKAVLRLATHIVSDLLPGVAYFPAYELMTDDLRDYRFYAADMLHPSEVAEDYIWEKFARTYFDADFGRFRKEWAALRQSLAHRPLHAAAPEHRQFLESTREKLEQLSLRRVDVEAEMRQVSTQLAALPAPRLPQPAAELEDDEERIDIGEGTTAMLAEGNRPAAAPASSESRPARLSPEEFRAQRAARPERGRRDGRGKGRLAQPTENEQFQTGTLAADFAPDDTDDLLAAPLVPAEGSVVQPGPTDATMPLSGPTNAETAGEGEEGLKKKKRRSRGGAKRTARKNALRLAAGEGLPDTEPAPDDTAATATDTTSADNYREQAEARKSSVITKSVPVKRGGGRNEPGRVPRVELFASTATPAETETGTETTPAPSETTQLAAAEPTIATGPAATAPQASPVDARNRGNRNNNERNNNNNRNNNRGNVAPETVESDANRSAATPGAADALVIPVVATSPPETVVAAAAPVAARQPRRSKARVVSAARAEKPAIDTPVVPVPDPLLLRTQVAAGRMTGTTATLVAPTAAPEAVVVTKKAPVPQKSAAKAAQPAPAAVAAPLPAAGKPRNASKTPPMIKAALATPEPTPAQAVVATPVAVGKPKAAGAKAPVAKAPTVKAAAVKASEAKPKAAKAPTNTKAASLAKSTVAKPAASKAPVAAPVEDKAPAAKPAVKAAVTKAPAAKLVAAKPAPKATAKAAAVKPAAAKPAPKAVAKAAAQPASSKKVAAKVAAPKRPKKAVKP